LTDLITIIKNSLGEKKGNSRGEKKTKKQSVAEASSHSSVLELTSDFLLEIQFSCTYVRVLWFKNDTCIV